MGVTSDSQSLTIWNENVPCALGNWGFYKAFSELFSCLVWTLGCFEGRCQAPWAAGPLLCSPSRQQTLQPGDGKPWRTELPGERRGEARGHSSRPHHEDESRVTTGEGLPRAGDCAARGRGETSPSPATSLCQVRELTPSFG